MATFAIPLAIAGLSALGGVFGNRKKTTTQTLSGTQATNRTATQMPTYDPQALAMRDNLIKSFMARLSPGRAQGLAQDITTGNILNINKGAAAQRRALEASLASRGLGFAGLGSALGSEMEGNRIGEIVRALNQRRTLAEQIQQGDLAGAGQFFGQLPAGSTMTESGTTTTNQTGTSTDPGNMLGGLFGGLGTSLAGMYGATQGFGKYTPDWTSILGKGRNLGDYGNPPAWNTDDYGNPWSENPATMGTQGFLMNPASLYSNILNNRQPAGLARILGNMGGANLLQGGLLGAFLRR